MERPTLTNLNNIIENDFTERLFNNINVEHYNTLNNLLQDFDNSFNNYYGINGDINEIAELINLATVELNGMNFELVIEMMRLIDNWLRTLRGHSLYDYENYETEDIIRLYINLYLESNDYPQEREQLIANWNEEHDNNNELNDVLLQ